MCGAPIVFIRRRAIYRLTISFGNPLSYLSRIYLDPYRDLDNIRVYI